MSDRFLYICVIVILLIEIYKYNTKLCENFSSSPTNYILSKKETDSDVYATEDKEELIGIQLPNKDKQWLYNFIKAPLGRDIALYVKKVTDNKENVIKTVFVKNINSSSKVLNIFGFNNALIQDNTNAYKYYIKFLSGGQYNKELAEYERSQKIRRDFDLCVNTYTGTISKKEATAKCQASVAL